MGHSSTPASVLFDLMKRRFGISHKELATIILSGRPLPDGRSPASRVNDRTWVSRFVVHARPEEWRSELFGDFSVSALRIISRMKSQHKGSFAGKDVLAFVCGAGSRAMEEALRGCGQPTGPYRALLDRVLADDSLTVDERAEAAMTLMVSAACTANVERSVEKTRAFVYSVHGNYLATPSSEALGANRLSSKDDAAFRESVDGGESVPQEPWVGLLRVEGGLIVGDAQWIAPGEEGAVIGSLVAGASDVCAAAVDVSGRHARIWRDGSGTWRVEDLGSRNGTVLISGLSGEQMEVGAESSCELHPGDQLHLGVDTTFVIVEGFPE